jgi:hypothetical protein
MPSVTFTPAVTATRIARVTPSPEGTNSLGPTPFNPAALIPRTQTMAPTSKPGIVLNPKTPTASPQEPTRPVNTEITPSPLPAGNEEDNEPGSFPVAKTILILAGIVLVLLIVLLWSKSRQK